MAIEPAVNHRRERLGILLQGEIRVIPICPPVRNEDVPGTPTMILTLSLVGLMEGLHVAHQQLLACGIARGCETPCQDLYRDRHDAGAGREIIAPRWFLVSHRTFGARSVDHEAQRGVFIHFRVPFHSARCCIALALTNRVRSTVSPVHRKGGRNLTKKGDRNSSPKSPLYDWGFLPRSTFCQVGKQRRLRMMHWTSTRCTCTRRVSDHQGDCFSA